MAFHLTNIELNIDDSVLAKAEKLLDGKCLQALTETDSGLWVGLVNTEEGSFEIEVLLKGSQVKAYTCDCGRAGKKHYCEHVVTLLLHLLAESKKEIKKTVSKKLDVAPKRVTVSYLLNLVKPKDLKHFIKEYASEDRHFTLLLKAHFAYLLPRTKDSEPIEQVLINTIKSIKRPGKTLSRSDWKMLQKVLKTLLQQAEDSLYKKHYSDVFETTEAIIHQLNPLLLMVDDRQILIKNITEAITLLQEMCKQQLAPELEDQIWALCYSESDKKVYYLYNLWDALLNLLVNLATTSIRSEALLELLDNKLTDRFVVKNERISAGLVNYKIQLFELQHNEAALHRYLEDNINHPEVLKQAIQLARQKENWKQLEQLSRYAISTQEPDERELLYLQGQLLDAAVHQNKRKSIHRLGQVLFLQTYRIEYFQLFKKAAGKKWVDKRTELLDQLQNQPSRLDNRKILALIFAEENMIEDLIKHLHQSKSMDLLKEYDSILFKQNISETTKLYFEITNHYLENYMGRPAAIKIRESIDHLKHIGQPLLAADLVSFIRNRFGDRRSLLAELT